MTLLRQLELISNPHGRISTSDTTVVGAFVVSSLVLLWCAFTRLFGAYLAAWVAQNQASKFAALKRDREVPKDGNRPNDAG
ncbi:hypothetical protein SSYM_2250 [Serratia symbiotica str. Tucson]|uniref:Uncharacterized protein n=2 Tax=Serratia symbiotica TaxID=138074 RepID=E9CP26_9GAMM|nr:hypothetical protein [Serratia symbiotica]EFW11617.1 hypothetical protein SSYM_2250 [Serratia symbiotica str. Tucson]BBI91164.1 uncharacterized protein SSYIS1_02190 [Serratia symbiotica]